ncbi:2-succinyl-6-hydroxy-2,4-cyclohexadiene-1-carboxylate synthase [Aeromonas hydrophila]|uniref:2-succinyl-6-hydroxy-2, 4-cyclohexadiene-1-carboxylate synthase n=1 Tax=Aeromonas hydrophila TaxID=644 RepID=UPI000332B631|nr:2-succinyl-6-hydroxy-2,4-cyclohexadiene-1-carboxylate synthase [Aeromonas hydrophila]AGM42328.1 alpha/beta hydrolase [Aeromonas hydrophila ML09-119]AHX31053.1 alpha/beta hydrolase [Aeromonas hydrophila subsp. hydrophila AL09-71]AHX67848.1 alpha/beta hydrolase [Aeromonas hydrophila pc104A]AJE38099.1 alpha/beta hydrolase [Aeromonas hydrophila J-1]AKJ36398.1 alpha/beta hydrolase [Aeromonas hydrophila NJ-35]
MAASADQPTLVLLHGLLGDANDWQPVQAALTSLPSLALDLPGHGSNQAVRVTGFEQAHRWLCNELAARGIDRYQLVGYSLGGRLALYHASQSPAGLQALLLENCHPGLPPAERPARLAHDEGWARRFEQEPLAAVLADWYRQGVFADLGEDARARQIARRLGNDGKAVAAMLRATSLGQQPDLGDWLAQGALPVTWVSGKRDHKFHQLACLMASQHRKINHLELDGGHNLHAHQPETFARLLAEWANQQQEEKRHD